jgi:hypothetical protein
MTKSECRKEIVLRQQMPLLKIYEIWLGRRQLAIQLRYEKYQTFCQHKLETIQEKIKEIEKGSN